MELLYSNILPLGTMDMEEIAQNARSRSAKLRYAIKKQLEV